MTTPSSSSEQVIKVMAPVFVTLESPDGQKSVRKDLYVVRRMLRDAEKKPSEEERWSFVLDWLAKEWEIDRDTLTENMAVHLNNSVMALVTEKNKELAKENFTHASSAASTGEAPQPTK